MISQLNTSVKFNFHQHLFSCLEWKSPNIWITNISGYTVHRHNVQAGWRMLHGPGHSIGSCPFTFVCSLSGMYRYMNNLVQRDAWHTWINISRIVFSFKIQSWSCWYIWLSGGVCSSSHSAILNLARNSPQGIWEYLAKECYKDCVSELNGLFSGSHELVQCVPQGHFQQLHKVLSNTSVMQTLNKLCEPQGNTTPILVRKEVCQANVCTDQDK